MSCVCVCIYVCMYVCVYIYIYIYIYLHLSLSLSEVYCSTKHCLSYRNRKLSGLHRIISVADFIPEAKLKACFLHAELKRKCVEVIISCPEKMQSLQLGLYRELILLVICWNKYKNTASFVTRWMWPTISDSPPWPWKNERISSLSN